MGKIKKELCKLKKDDIQEYEDEIMKEVRNPKYVCKKCIRVAANKDMLCKPKKIESSS